LRHRLQWAAPWRKTILIGWMSNWQYAEKLPTSPWRGQMSLPRRVTFVQDGAGLSLKQEPVIAALEESPRSFTVRSETDSHSTEIALGNAPYELDLHFEHTSEKVIGVRIYSDPQHWTEIGFDTQTRQFYMDRTKGGATVAAGFATKTVAPLISGRPYDVKLIVDRSSIEAYAQEGTIAMTNLIYPDSQKNKLIVFTQEGNPVVVRGTLRKLRSIWR
jgi:fructan beta-fructosidase